MKPILEARGITKRFGAIEALRGVGLATFPGEIRALCGENGAGKSTLVKILTGVHRPDLGTILVDDAEVSIRRPEDAQALGIAFVSQELSIVPHLSVNDNLWLGHRDVPLFHRRRALRTRARETLATVGLDHIGLDSHAGSLSLGERQLLEVARMLIRDARVLILDEPTATLSDNEIAKVFDALRRLRSQGRAIIFITHRLGEGFDICDSVTVLRGGAGVGSFPTAEIDRAALIELMLGRALGKMYPPGADASAAAALTVRGLTVPRLVEGISFDIPRGKIGCLAGQIGSGAIEAARALAGLDYRARGTVSVNGRPMPLGSVPAAQARNVRFVSEDRAGEGIFLELPVDENLVATQLAQLGKVGLLFRGRVRTYARRIAELVGVDPGRLSVLSRAFSGGNQQKIAVGRSITGEHAGVLVMNEPTRGVDVGARAEIYGLMRKLCDAGLTILITTTDIEEIVGMSDKVITLYRGHMVGEYEGVAIDRNRILSDMIHRPGTERAAS